MIHSININFLSNNWLIYLICDFTMHPAAAEAAFYDPTFVWW
jgi:hypothetical protein